MTYRGGSLRTLRTRVTIRSDCQRVASAILSESASRVPLILLPFLSYAALHQKCRLNQKSRG